MSEENEGKGADKKQLVTAGITAAVFTVFFGILVLFALLSRGSWTRGLRTAAEQVLFEQGIAYAPLEPVELRSSTEVSVAAFRASGAQDAYVAVVRITTLYGPLPAVYTYTAGDQTARFVAFAELHSKARRQIEDSSRASAIAYWAQKVPSIIQTSPAYTEDLSL